MKSIVNKLLMVATALVMATTFQSCSELKCRNTTCENGECEDGTCNCYAGWEGELCDKLVRAKFYGIYNGNEECDNSEEITIVVTEGNLDHEIFLENLYAENSRIEASVSGNNITIGIQTNYQGSAIFNINGSGTLSGNTLTLSYTIEDDGEFESCSTIVTK